MTDRDEFIDSLNENIQEYSEIMNSVRHYSNLRFSILSRFFWVTVALMIGLFSPEILNSRSNLKDLSFAYAIGGILTTVVFLWYDIAVNQYQTAFVARLDKVWRNSHWNSRPTIVKNIFQWPMWFLYLSVLLFWIYISWIVYNQ